MTEAPEFTVGPVEQGIPVPTNSPTKHHLPLEGMEVGDSFKVDFPKWTTMEHLNVARARIYASITNRCKGTDQKFTTRIKPAKEDEEKSSIRVWRIQ